MSPTLSLLQLHLSLLFFDLGPRSFLLYTDFQSIWRDTLQKSQAYMLSAHNPKREEKTQVPPKYPRESLAWENVTCPYLKISLSPWGCSTMIVKCTFLGLGLDFGTIIQSLPALRGAQKFLRGPA